MISGIIFVLGLLIGSFLNVVIDRLPRGESIVWKPSHCDHCKKPLRWYELFPVVSFLFLRGRCLRCKKQLSVQYPIIEFVAASGFLFISLTTSDINRVAPLIIIYCIFLVLFVIDLKHQILPDELLIVLLVVALYCGVFLVPAERGIRLVSGLAAGSGFFLLWLVTRGRGLGFGDVKLALILGFLLGYPSVIIALYIAFLTGALVGVILILSHRAKMRTKIAFGPFLIIGAMSAYLWGERIWALWLTLIT